MTQLACRILLALAVCVCALNENGLAVAKEASPPLPVMPPLPEGNTGIASKFAADAGIEKDPAVLFHDDFSAGNFKKWDRANNGSVPASFTHFVDYPQSAHSAKKAVEFTVPKSDAESGTGMEKWFKPGVNVLFLRYYSKFDKDFDQIGSSHNGSYMSASYDRDGHATPGERADGKNKFLVGLEDWRGEDKDRSPGELNFYCYHPEQRSNYGDHFYPSGLVMPYGENGLGNKNTFGANFVKRPDFLPELDRWYCFEFMVKVNTPGERDGRIACWIDGKLTADIPNFRLRDVDTLKIDKCSLSLHIKNPSRRDNKKYYADVVMASSYIGPMVEKAVAAVPVASETKTPAAPKPPPVVIAADALAPWEAKLSQRVAQGVKDGQTPKAWLKLAGHDEEVKVVGIDEKTLRVEQAGGVLPLPLASLSAVDRLNLSRAFIKEDNIDDYLLAGVLALAADRAEVSNELFAKAQVLDAKNGTARVKEVRAALGLK